MKRVAIFGKSSYLGNNFAEYLKNNDEYIIEKINSRDGEWEQRDFSKYDVVYFVAGKAHVDMNKADPNEYYAVNRDLPIAVAKKLKEQGVKQFIFLSSIYVFGIEGVVGKPCNITLDTPYGNKFAYGISKAEADTELIKLNSEEFKVAIVRPPMIYGKDSKGNFPRLYSLARKIAMFPNYQNERSMIYVKNLDEFIKRIIDSNSDGIFYPQNRDFVSTCDMFYTIREVLGKKTWHTKLFNWCIKSLGNKIGVCRKLFGNVTVDKTLSNTFDFEYAKYGLKESLQDIILGKEEHGVANE